MIYAKSNNNEDTHIIDSKKNETYRCLICGEEVIPRKGDQTPWHFAHKESGYCSYEKNIGCIKFLKVKFDRCKASDICDLCCEYKK